MKSNLFIALFVLILSQTVCLQLSHSNDETIDVDDFDRDQFDIDEDLTTTDGMFDVDDSTPMFDVDDSTPAIIANNETFVDNPIWSTFATTAHPLTMHMDENEEKDAAHPDLVNESVPALLKPLFIDTSAPPAQIDRSSPEPYRRLLAFDQPISDSIDDRQHSTSSSVDAQMSSSHIVTSPSLTNDRESSISSTIDRESLITSTNDSNRTAANNESLYRTPDSAFNSTNPNGWLNHTEIEDRPVVQDVWLYFGIAVGVAVLIGIVAIGLIYLYYRRKQERHQREVQRWFGAMPRSTLETY